MKRFVTLQVLVLLISISWGQTSKAPIIGISSTWGEGSQAQAPLTYVNSVKAAGGVPMVLPITQDSLIIERMLDMVDAVIMTGGEDVDPLAYYGEEPLNSMGSIVPQRDRFDYMLIRAAVKRGVPLLGICRGEQMLNVAFGGTLYQDIPSQVKGTFVKHRQSAPGDYGTHTINIDKSSVLFLSTGLEQTTVNSFHHQAVKDIAPGFRVTAYSKDGVAEAIEMEGNPKVFGVQFHPEAFVSKGDKRFLGIFEYLISLAVDYRASLR